MIYLDHAAATLPFAEVLHIDTELYANPSSVHGPGRQARGAIDLARRQVAQACECEPVDVIFTSGATEAMHLAIIGHWLAKKERRGIIYASPLVHSCVWAALHFLEKNFAVEVRHLPIDNQGFLDLAQIGESVFEAADLIITEFGSSEIGLLQPVTKLGKKLDKWAQEQKNSKPALIVDAAAAVVTEKIALEYQKCDFITLSGEKFGGLKGSGVLIRRPGLDLESIIGGAHELGARGGTENVVGAVALGMASKLHSEQKAANRKQFCEFHDYVRTFVNKELTGCRITTPVENFLPHVFHILLPEGTKAAVLVAQADLAGLAISAGSACSSGTTTESKVLLALGKSPEEAERGIRISWGRTTAIAELSEGLGILKQLIK